MEADPEPAGRNPTPMENQMTEEEPNPLLTELPDPADEDDGTDHDDQQAAVFPPEDDK